MLKNDWSSSIEMERSWKSALVRIPVSVGKSIASTVDEMEKLFEGFDLCASNTSVSKTINGNYWWHLAAFFNVAIRQQIKKFEKIKISVQNFRSKIKKMCPILNNLKSQESFKLLRECQRATAQCKNPPSGGRGS